MTPSRALARFPATVTVDASVFINAYNPDEDEHEESRAFLARLRSRATPIIVPNLLAVEAAAGIARAVDDSDLAKRFADRLMRLPHLIPVSLDGPLTSMAADLAADRRLRGADAVYGAVALRFGTALITRDRQQLERLVEVVPTLHPRDWQARD